MTAYKLLTVTPILFICSCSSITETTMTEQLSFGDGCHDTLSYLQSGAKHGLSIAGHVSSLILPGIIPGGYMMNSLSNLIPDAEASADCSNMGDSNSTDIIAKQSLSNVEATESGTPTVKSRPSKRRK